MSNTFTDQIAAPGDIVAISQTNSTCLSPEASQSPPLGGPSPLDLGIHPIVNTPTPPLTDHIFTSTAGLETIQSIPNGLINTTLSSSPLSTDSYRDKISTQQFKQEVS